MQAGNTQSAAPQQAGPCWLPAAAPKQGFTCAQATQGGKINSQLLLSHVCRPPSGLAVTGLQPTCLPTCLSLSWGCLQEREQAQVAQYKEAMEAVRKAALAFEAVKERRSEAFMAAFDHISGIIDSVFKVSCSTSRAFADTRLPHTGIGLSTNSTRAPSAKAKPMVCVQNSHLKLKAAGRRLHSSVDRPGVIDGPLWAWAISGMPACAVQRCGHRGHNLAGLCCTAVCNDRTQVGRGGMLDGRLPCYLRPHQHLADSIVQKKTGWALSTLSGHKTSIKGGNVQWAAQLLCTCPQTDTEG